ncbi:MAG: hypothetical protein WDA16_13645 [Candidatus Thermoplasmatota archaeon]
MSFLELLDRIHHANLTGYALMLVMLACFLVGAIATRLAIELDVYAREFDNVPEGRLPDEALIS